jgi:hypothetical protein
MNRPLFLLALMEARDAPRYRVMKTQRCALCGREFYDANPQPVGEQGAEFFGVKDPHSFVCYFCLDNINVEPQDQKPGTAQ